MFLFADSKFDFLAGIGGSGYFQRAVALQHHVVGVNHRHLQPAEITCDGRVNRLSQYAGSFCIGVHGIVKQLMVGIHRLKEINQLSSADSSYGFNGLLNFAVPVAGARFKAGMTVGDGSHPGNEDSCFGVGCSERLDEMQVILYKKVAVIRPVSRVCIVDSEMNHHDVGSKSDGLLVFRLLHIGPVTLVEQGGSRFAEISYRVFIAKHLLQLSRIGFRFPVLERVAIGDAVACARHFDGLRLKQSGKNKCEDNQ